jgi:hypothetical protein
VTCYTQSCKPCKITCILHYLPQGDESSPRGRWGICAPALTEVLTWLHTTKPTAFSLVVDDVAVKYVTEADAHLRNALLRHYEITTDCGGTVYSRITLKWDYFKRTCEISLPGYINNVLNKFKHDTPKTPQHTPSKYITSVYGAKMQYISR